VADERLVPLPVPPLVAIFAMKERDLGRPLSEEEVIEIRDAAACIMLPISEARKMAEARGYDDIDPENAWEDWQQVRAHLDE
jgi:hypothetical protein